MSVRKTKPILSLILSSIVSYVSINLGCLKVWEEMTPYDLIQYIDIYISDSFYFIVILGNYGMNFVMKKNQNYLLPLHPPKMDLQDLNIS